MQKTITHLELTQTRYNKQDIVQNQNQTMWLSSEVKEQNRLENKKKELQNLEKKKEIVRKILGR